MNSTISFATFVVQYVVSHTDIIIVPVSPEQQDPFRVFAAIRQTESEYCRRNTIHSIKCPFACRGRYSSRKDSVGNLFVSAADIQCGHNKKDDENGYCNARFFHRNSFRLHFCAI